MIYPVRLDTRFELKCNLFCTPARVAINNHSKSFPIIRNDLRLIEMNSSHSKTVMTLLAHRALHTLLGSCKMELNIFFYSLNFIRRVQKGKSYIMYKLITRLLYCLYCRNYSSPKHNCKKWKKTSSQQGFFKLFWIFNSSRSQFKKISIFTRIHYSGPSHALYYLGGNIFQNRAFSKAFELT